MYRLHVEVASWIPNPDIAPSRRESLDSPLYSDRLPVAYSLYPLVNLYRQTGIRNADNARNALEDSSAVHHRKLASDKYTFAGNGLTLDAYWTSDTCDYGSSLYLYATEGVTKYQSNGKPIAGKSTYASGGFDLWTDCGDTTATHIYAYFDVYGSDGSTLAVAKKLETAAYGLDTEIFVVTETCMKRCYAEEEGGEYCYYGDCITESEGFVPVTLDASFAATSATSTFSERSKYSGPGYSYRFTSKGKERPASGALSLTLDGSAVDIPGAETYGSMRQTTSGNVFKY